MTRYGEGSMRIRLDDDEAMDVVRVFGQYGLYKDVRFEEREGLWKYECREGEDEYIAQIEPWVWVNFSGTMFFKEPLRPEDAWYKPTSEGDKPIWDGFLRDNDNGFAGEILTVAEYMSMSREELEAFMTRREE